MKIELSDTEITHIMDSLRERVNDLREDHSISGDIETADLANELEELEHDLFEALNRRDGWGDGATDRFPDAALDMVQAGIDAREQAKASSMAAERRAERMMRGTATPVIAEWNPNDPSNW